MASPIDETAADLPVRDLGINLSDSPSPQRINARKVLSRNTREELEDKYLNLHDENLLLKQHARKQEDKIKRMATKLIRLVQDKKKAEQGMGVPRRSGKDVELEEMIEQLQENVRELEKQNESLHHRLIATKQQLQTQGHRHNPYSYTQARINSGLRKVTEDVLIQENIRRGMRVQNPEVTSKSTQAALPRYGHSLLEEARSEIRNLENMVESQRSRIEELENATDILKEELQRKEKEHEETFLQLREQQTTGQRTTIKENVVIIKLQKQLAEKSRNIAEMENKFHSLQENLNTMKANQDAFLNEVDNLHSQLKEERLKSFHLEKQLQDTRFSQNRVEELLDRISDLEKERDLLKENSDKLYSSAFTVSNSQEQQRKLREQQLKFQIAQLEAALKSDLEDKNEILDRMRREREHAEKIDEENKKLQLRCLEQKHQLDEFQNKLKFFTKESDIDVTELSEALMLIKTRKQQKNDELRFLERVEDDIGKDLEKSLRELQASHAETVQELEKTRNMLIMQHKINKDYQVEVETVMQKMEGMHHDFEIKVEQYVHLLDVRAARIRRLEGQLKDIAYGTKLYKFTPEITPDDVDDSVCLERGQNIFEIHISKAVFTPAAANIFGDQDPSTFCTYAFYDFELQTTPVVRGLQPSYQFTSHYVVQVDDFFLQYIQSSTVRLEVHQAVGTDFKTIAVCQLRFHDILEKTGTIFSSSNLIGIANDIGHCGSVEYWVKLKVPMEQAIRLYRERAKALGYISSNLRDPLQNYPSTGIGKSEDNLNELFIVVNSCSSLQLETSTQQPSPYVAYTFFHFPDHYSHTIPSSNNPHFEYLKSFPVSMNAELDRYLKSESLAFYVFDDKETSDTYIGKAKVPLIPLAHDKRISGTFQLTDPKGNKTGTIQITLEWKNTYLPPKDTILAEPFIDELQKEASIPVRLLTDEEVPVPKITNKQNIPAIPMPKPRVRKPTTDKKVSFVDTSVKTPLENDKLEKEEFLKNSLQENPPEINGSSLLSDGQYGAQSIDTSDDETEITEDFEGEDHDGKQTTDGNESTATDSDDCIIPVAKEVKPVLEKIRIEIISLSLNVDSEVIQNETIKRLFVEYKLGNLPAEETPVSLPKPTNGQLIHYNYSNVIHLDKTNNQSKRDSVRSALNDPNSNSGSIKFIVVSDPPEDEQDLECDDIGFSYISLKEILQTGEDVINQKIHIYESVPGTKVIGKMTVTVEAAEALRSLMKD
ncbi:protein fantom [Gastrophryne carolinensis]